MWVKTHTSHSHQQPSQSPPASAEPWPDVPEHDPTPPRPAGYVCSGKPPRPRPAHTTRHRLKHWPTKWLPLEWPDYFLVQLHVFNSSFTTAAHGTSVQQGRTVRYSGYKHSLPQEPVFISLRVNTVNSSVLKIQPPLWHWRLLPLMFYIYINTFLLTDQWL